MKYQIENNEIYRLARLADYKILDTGFDDSFDDLVTTVGAHFGVPIALVTLVDADRQWFKAMVGLDVRQTPRHHSFCTHAIMRPDEVMVIEDATGDPRFNNNPLVIENPHIRFYAGAPIVADSGDTLGTVCVFDRVPRTFDQADKDMLARFARAARSLLELHRHNESLREAVMRDPLTGLLNRRGLENTLRQSIASALNGAGCGLLYLDLDDFKQVNDRYGHALGDSLLEELARRLQGAVRQGDLVARFGGDKFVVLLAHPVDAAVLEHISQRLLSACGAPVTLKGHTITPHISLGGALAPRDAINHHDLLRAADNALYCAKRAGRGQLVIQDADAAVRAQGDKSLQMALSDAVDRDELFLEWQSCHDIKTGEIVGYEALVRWQHPEFGRLAPDRFIPLAEACGLSSRLDAWVMFHACEEAAACQADGYFAVNISAQWIANGNVVPLIRAALEQSGLSADRLILEITESTVIGSEDDAIAHMRQLKDMGLLLALDDFGTGYSALVSLQTFPFDVLKLDRRFTTATAANTRGRQVAEAVIQLANTLNIKVVAEGIETQSQLDVLTQIGCHLGQGFFWAKAQRAPWLGDAEPNAQGQIAHGLADITVSADSTEAPGNGLPLYDPMDNHSGMACPAEEFTPKSIKSERRSESRVAILLHVAKLVVDEHEHFCIIRDASSTGLKVKLFAPLPNHEDLAVELANGERYKAQCVWTNGKNIGLQFCEPFPLDHLLDHAKHVGRRRHLRLRTALDGMLQIGEKTASITVRDISQHGAALETKKWLSVNELVKIQVPALPDVYAKVRWRNHPYYGVVFERTFQLEELATRVFAAQAHAARKRHDGAYG